MRSVPSQVTQVNAFRPKGTQVNSQGREPLERVISYHSAATRRHFDLDLLV